MVVHRIVGVGAVAALLVAGPALAVPQHVAVARARDGAEAAVYAVAPGLDAASRRAHRLEAGRLTRVSAPRLRARDHPRRPAPAPPS